MQRLTENKAIVRIAQGIYTIPEIDPIIGQVMPGIDAVAKAIAKRDKATIVRTGVYALNKLGLRGRKLIKVTYLV